MVLGALDPSWCETFCDDHYAYCDRDSCSGQ